MIFFQHMKLEKFVITKGSYENKSERQIQTKIFQIVFCAHLLSLFSRGLSQAKQIEFEEEFRKAKGVKRHYEEQLDKLNEEISEAERKVEQAKLGEEVKQYKYNLIQVFGGYSYVICYTVDLEMFGGVSHIKPWVIITFDAAFCIKEKCFFFFNFLENTSTGSGILRRSRDSN